MFNVNKEKCIGCSQCVKDCPVSAISLVDNKAEINNERCFKCSHCIAICPVEAVSTDDYNMEEVIPYDKDLKENSISRDSKVVQDAIKQFYFRLNLPQIKQ